MLVGTAPAPKAGAAVVALDGRSGAGKSTLAKALALRAGDGCLDRDDFYSRFAGEADAPQRDG